MVGGDVGRVAAVICGDEEQIIGAQSVQQSSQLAVERLQCSSISGSVVAVAVLGVEVDEIGEDEIGVGTACQVDRLPHSIGIRFGANLGVDADAVENVGDLAQADDPFSPLVRTFHDRFARRSDREVFAVRRPLEMTLARSDERTGDDAADVVLAAHDKELLAISGVVGVYVGTLQDRRTPCLKVMLARKTPESARKVPRSIEGYPVVIEINGEIRALGKP